MIAARAIAQEGIVLLKNEGGLLPLTDCGTLALFSLRSIDPVFNGGGSASSDVSHYITLEQGLRQAGFKLNEDIINLNKNYLYKGKPSIKPFVGRPRVKRMQGGGAEFISGSQSPKSELPTQVLLSTRYYSDGKTIIEHARKQGNTALIVISRGGGEGYELNTAHLRLTQDEQNLIAQVGKVFSNIALIFNTCNTIELGDVADHPSVKAILWIGYSGSAGMQAVGDILSGKVNPSGHLTDAWLKDNTSTPAANNLLQREQDGSWSLADRSHCKAKNTKNPCARWPNQPQLNRVLGLGHSKQQKGHHLARSLRVGGEL